jgi:P-type Cu+ transporter
MEEKMGADAALVKDVVCGMMIDPAAAAARRTYDGRDFFFCGKGCAAAFDSNPEDYSLEEA